MRSAACPAAPATERRRSRPQPQSFTTRHGQFLADDFCGPFGHGAVVDQQHAAQAGRKELVPLPRHEGETPQRAAQPAATRVPERMTAILDDGKRPRRRPDGRLPARRRECRRYAARSARPGRRRHRPPAASGRGCTCPDRCRRRRGFRPAYWHGRDDDARVAGHEDLARRPADPMARSPT